MRVSSRRVYAALLVVALATVDCAEVPSIGIRRSGSSFVQLVFESAGRPVRLRAASRWGIAMTALFDPTMRAVKEQLYQSERPWLVGSSKFERAFGSGAKPQQQAVPATVARFRDYVGR
jgi:hypothetical protein